MSLFECEINLKNEIRNKASLLLDMLDDGEANEFCFGSSSNDLFSESIESDDNSLFTIALSKGNGIFGFREN